MHSYLIARNLIDFLFQSSKMNKNESLGLVSHDRYSVPPIKR